MGTGRSVAWPSVKVDLVGQQPDAGRRGVLTAMAALTAAAIPGVSSAASFVEKAPASGGGLPTSTGAESAKSMMTVRSAMAPAADWKQHLLRGERSIRMRREGVTASIRYCTADGILDLGEYQRACHMLRDVRANKLHPMDPRLLDVLCGIQRWMSFNGLDAVIQIQSGFRTAATNSSTEGAAKNSMHLVGKAADIVIPGVRSAVVGAMVKEFNGGGGTGIYLSRGFVHVDTGAARSWVSNDRRARKPTSARGRP